jgi:GT2 family glycosyltransferase
MKLISIVILVGPNSRDKVFKAINSVLKSEYKNYEILLIDNSEDEELCKLLKINFSFPKVKIYKMPFNTAIFGYSLGFSNAAGEYILTLDDDCTIEKNTLTKIIKDFDSLPKNIVIMSTNVYNPIKKYFYYENYIENDADYILTFLGGASVFRREIFDTVGYYDKDFFCWLHEDDFAIRVIDSGNKIYFNKKIIINHFDPENQKKIRSLKFRLTYRNKAWFNLKYFSWFFLPVIILRDLIWVLMVLVRTKSIRAFWYSLCGYFEGYINFLPALNKRQKIQINTQFTYLMWHLFFRFKTLKQK